MIKTHADRFLLFFLLAVGVLFFGVGRACAEPSTDREWFLAAVNTPRDMKPAKGKKKIVVAVVDDGVRITHQDLKGFIWTNPREIPGNNIDDDGNGFVDDVHGWDVADNRNSVIPPQGKLQEYYHGTHLAGIIARIARNAYGEAATEFIRIMPVKSLSDKADKPYIKDGYKGIEYAVKSGADIVLCAWGAGRISPDEEKILENARKHGVLIVASAGNFPEERDQFPAAHKGVLGVAAIGQDKKKIEKSNFGAFIDLSGPGVNILSSSVLSDFGYEQRDGSSSAAAIVAAAAAIVQLQHPSYSAEKITACLKSSADGIHVEDVQYSAKLGAGALNIGAAAACRLFHDKTPKVSALDKPQGYLHFHKSGEKLSSWTIKPQGVFRGIRFSLLSLEGKPGKGMVSFYSGDSSEKKLLARYPLSRLPEDVYVPGTTAFVTFETALPDRKLNWLMEYHAEPINFGTLYCGGTVHVAEEGILEDGSGPENYSPKSDCKWLITAPEGNVIHFTFTEFDTEARTDLLYFFHGAGTHEKIMAIFSGPNIPPEFTTWSNQVLVWFVTDGKNQGKGWKTEIRFKEP